MKKSCKLKKYENGKDMNVKYARKSCPVCDTRLLSKKQRECKKKIHFLYFLLIHTNTRHQKISINGLS